MNKKNLFKIFFLLTVSFVVEVDYCVGQKKSTLLKLATSKEARGFMQKGFRKIISADQDNKSGKITEKKKAIRLTPRIRAKQEKEKIEAQLKRGEEGKEKMPSDEETTLKETQKKLGGFIRKANKIEDIEEKTEQKEVELNKEIEMLEFMKKRTGAKKDENIKKSEKRIKDLQKEFSALEKERDTQMQELREEEIYIEKYLKGIDEETEEKSGGLSGIKKTGLATLATAGVGGLTTGTTSAIAGTLFAGAQALQEDEEEGVFLETEEEKIEGETVSEDEATDEEPSPESPVEKTVKKTEKEPAGSIIGELISSAKEVAGEAAEVAAVSMATGTQKEEMIKEIKEEAAEAKIQEKKKQEKEKTKDLKKETKIKVKLDDRKNKEKVAAKQEVLKVISLSEDMELTSKQAESLLSILAGHANKVLKKSSRLFANDEKKKSFTTISGETITVIGKDFSKEYLDKYQSTLDIYKKARNEYKALLKDKKSDIIIDEDQLASNKRYYEEMKDKAREAFIEKQTAINNKALYYQPDGKASALKIIQEGVKIIQKHTPENFEEIDLLKIFPYLKPLDIESKDILPSSKEADKRDDLNIEEELFEEAMAGKQEDIKKHQQEATKELEEFGKEESFWN